jgi:hypothetical protein
MNKGRLQPSALAIAVSAVLLSACAPNVSREDVARATEGYVEDVNKLFVVDCLLPGQVRKLGSSMTYISSRRPIRATAAECEARGGEYVAYDRANSASALGVWLPRAQEGDVEAQVMVGQIFERGQGQVPDYPSAYQWYKKAAEKGNAQAQLNLGHLYEQGLGVAKDPVAAMQWYRKASGLESANLQFAAAPTAIAPVQAAANTQELDSLRQEAQQSRAEAAQLRERLNELQQKSKSDQAALKQSHGKSAAEVESLRQEAERSRSEAEQLRERLQEIQQASASERSSQSKNDQELAALRQQAEQSRAESEALRARLNEVQQKAASDQAALSQVQGKSSEELEALRQQAEKSQAEAAELRARMSELQQASASARQAQGASSQELEALRSAAEKSQKESAQLRDQMLAMQQQLMDQQDSLRKAQDELGSAREKMQQEKASATPADDSAVKAMEENLRRKEAQLKAEQKRVSSIASSLEKERQNARREAENARKKQAAMEAAMAKQTAAAAAPAASKVSVTNSLQNELADIENTLRSKTNEYQQQSSELTQWLTAGGQDRAKIDARKQELQNKAKEIAALKDKLEQQNRKLITASAEPLKVVTGPNIEIIEPPITLTRGVPSIQVTAANKIKEIVGKINAPDGLSALIVNDKPQTVDASGLFRVPVTAGKDMGAIKIVATDKKNKRSDLTVNLTGEEQADGESFASATPSPGKAESVGGVEFGRYYALIIGNADYSAYPKLVTPINDAKSLDVVLRERYGFKTKLLINANRHTIMTALNEMRKVVGEADNLLIYYAGHGEIDKATQIAYWLPTDAESSNNANWISSQSITEMLSIMPARHSIIVADSCYSGALTGAAVAKLPDGMDAEKRAKWLKVMSSRKGRTVMTSGGIAPVMDAGGGGHSVFANAFLKVLRANNRVLEDYDVFRNVSGQVRTASARAGFPQSPQYAPLQHSGHEGSPFIFVPEA